MKVLKNTLSELQRPVIKHIMATSLVDIKIIIQSPVCRSYIRDTCSQLTWKSHSPHTHWGTFLPTLTAAQTLYLHESCLDKHKSEVCKKATSLFDMSIASSSSYSWYMQPVDIKLGGSDQRTFTGLHRTCSWWLTIYLYIYIINNNNNNKQTFQCKVCYFLL